MQEVQDLFDLLPRCCFCPDSFGDLVVHSAVCSPPHSGWGPGGFSGRGDLLGREGTYWGSGGFSGHLVRSVCEWWGP